jgi:acyl carrier protein
MAAVIVSSLANAILTAVFRLSMPEPASDSIVDGVIDVLKNVSRRPVEPTLDSDLVADLGFDSLQVLEVIAELEDRFDISIPLNDVPSTRTVAQVVEQVAALVSERSNA